MSVIESPLPPGAVLVHVGLHKTGTTAMQSLFAANRERLRELGVVYPGDATEHNHHRLARSFTQRALGPGGADKPPAPDLWRDQVAALASERRRVVLSSEYFSLAEPDQPARLVRDLGGRAHVLMGVRNVGQAAASAWQQTLKQRRVGSIEAWARNAIPRDGKAPREESFWRQWDLGATVGTWARAAGAENITVVVVDSADRRRLPTTFEQLLDLPGGFLADQEPPVNNRSMTRAEAELVRRLNAALRDELDWRTYREVVRYGAIRNVVEGYRPGPEEARPQLPAWAQGELHAAGVRYAEEIRATGVRVVGDLEALSAPPPVEAAEAPDTLPIDVAVQAVAGGVRAALAGRRRMEEIPAREMVEVLRARARRRVRESVAKARARRR